MLDDIWDAITESFEFVEMEYLIPAVILYVVGVGVMIYAFIHWENSGMNIPWTIKIGAPIIMIPITYFMAKHYSNKE